MILGAISLAHNFKTNIEMSSSPVDLVFLKLRMISLTSTSFTAVNVNESSIGLTFSRARGISGTLLAKLLPTSAKKLLNLFAVSVTLPELMVIGEFMV